MYNIDGTVLLRFIHFLKPPEISYWEVGFFFKTLYLSAYLIWNRLLKKEN